MYKLDCDVCHQPTWTGDLQYADKLRMCPECYKSWKSMTSGCECETCRISQNPEISQITIMTNDGENK